MFHLLFDGWGYLFLALDTNCNGDACKLFERKKENHSVFKYYLIVPF